MSEELNRFMAEKVMGWETKDVYDGHYWIYLSGTEKHIQHIKEANGEWFAPSSYWTPTTDMNQAMMCVEKFGRKFGLTLYEESMTWLVDLPEFEIDVENESAPLAICQAIKEALNEV